MNREDSGLWKELTGFVDRAKIQSGPNLEYRTYRWQQLRREALSRDHYECQVCASIGGYAPAKVVHHIRPAESFPEAFYRMDNLISLCRECHEILHNRVISKSKWPEMS